MKKKRILAALSLVLALWPELVRAAGGGGSEIIVVADTRQLTGFLLYIANLYNENIWMFALWSVLLTTALGATLGILMDFIMSRTGLDLGKTHKVEH